jgi:hypothetical protein
LIAPCDGVTFTQIADMQMIGSKNGAGLVRMMRSPSLKNANRERSDHGFYLP